MKRKKDQYYRGSVAESQKPSDSERQRHRDVKAGCVRERYGNDFVQPTLWLPQVGEQVGVKTSTAFVPPELAAIIFAPTASLENLQAQLQALFTQKKQASDDDDEDKQIALFQNIRTLRSRISQLQKGQGAADKLAAKPSFDVWSYGCVLYEVYVTRVFGVCISLKAA